MEGVFFNKYWDNVTIDFCTIRCKVLLGEKIMLRSFSTLPSTGMKIRNCNIYKKTMFGISVLKI